MFVSGIMVYTKDNLGELRQKLLDVGITDEDEMVQVANYLNQLAEIGYEVNKRKQNEAEACTRH